MNIWFVIGLIIGLVLARFAYVLLCDVMERKRMKKYFREHGRNNKGGN